MRELGISEASCRWPVHTMALCGCSIANWHIAGGGQEGKWSPAGHANIAEGSCGCRQQQFGLRLQQTLTGKPKGSLYNSAPPPTALNHDAAYHGRCAEG
jgi:hypothetical protein